jgi:hypothetical protein
LDELDLIIEQRRLEEKNRMRFAAALKGVDLDKDDDNSPEQRALEEAHRRAAVKIKGEEQAQREEYLEIGFGYESDS